MLLLLLLLYDAVKSNQQHHYENGGQLEFEMKFHYISCACCVNQQPATKLTAIRCAHILLANFFQVVFPLAWSHRNWTPTPRHRDQTTEPTETTKCEMASEQDRDKQSKKKERKIELKETQNWYHLHYYSAQVSVTRNRTERKNM